LEGDVIKRLCNFFRKKQQNDFNREELTLIIRDIIELNLEVLTEIPDATLVAATIVYHIENTYDIKNK
jgi:hypothetical protein